MSSTESEKTPPAVTGRCVVCKQVGYYKSGTFSEAQGHVYDAKGLKDWHQSRTCQGCVNNLYFKIESVTTVPAKKPSGSSGLY